MVIKRPVGTGLRNNRSSLSECQKSKFPTAFRKHTDGDREVDITEGNVADLLNALAQKYPDLKTHLFDPDGSLLSFVNVFVNDTNIRDLDGGATKLSDSDQVFLVPAMAGG